MSIAMPGDRLSDLDPPNRRADLGAVIDIGSNSTLLLVARYTPLTAGHRGGLLPLETLEEDARTTRLAQGLSPGGPLQPAAIARTRDAVAAFVRKASDQGVAPSAVRIVATEALRQASDSRMLIDAIRNDTGLVTDILSPRREGLLVHTGAMAGIGEVSYPCLVVDIGGGSTELIFQAAISDLPRVISLPLGCVGLTERFGWSDSVSEIAREPLLECIRRSLAVALKRLGISSVQSAIGVGGTMSTAAAMLRPPAAPTTQPIHAGRLSLAGLGGLLEQLAGRSLQDRRHMAGLDPERADIIPAGVAVCRELMRCLKVEEVCVSEWGLRHGVLLQARRNTVTGPLEA